MESVTVCPSCGKTIDRHFYFCPWCGCNQGDRTTFTSLLDDSCARLEQVAIENQTLKKRIAQLETQMDALFAELSDIQPSASQGHRGDSK